MLDPTLKEALDTAIAKAMHIPADLVLVRPNDRISTSSETKRQAAEILQKNNLNPLIKIENDTSSKKS
jgi:hypothetical protein